MINLPGTSRVAIVISTCLLLACVHMKAAKMVEVIQDWKALRYNQAPYVSPTAPDSFDTRSFIDYELEIMDSSEEYQRLQDYVLKYVQSADFVIRLSERIDHILPDSTYSQGNKLFAVYKPKAGAITWVAAIGSNELRIIRFRDHARATILDTTVTFNAASLLEGLEDAQSFFHLSDAYPISDLISVWTPDLKRHFSLFGFWVLRGSAWYKPHQEEKVPQGMWRLAELTRSQGAPKE